MLALPAAMSLADAIASQHAVRRYSPQPVDPEQIAALLQAAVRAPTAMHAEPWRFVVVQDRTMLKRFSEQAKQMLITQADALREVYDTAAVPDAGTFARFLTDPDSNLFYDAGTLIVICARLMNSFAAGDCWLAAQNLMLTATGMGLGTCCIGSAMPVLNAREIKSELKIPSDHTAVVAVIVGFSAEPPRLGLRKAPVVLSWSK